MELCFAEADGPQLSCSVELGTIFVKILFVWKVSIYKCDMNFRLPVMDETLLWF